MVKTVFEIVETTKKECEKRVMKMSKKLLTQYESVEYWLAGLEESSAKLYLRYFKTNPNESYDTLMEEIIRSRLTAISAADLLE